MDAITLIGLFTLVVKVVSVFKNIGKNNNAVLTQLLTWVVAFGVLALAANADVTEAIVIFTTHPLGELDFGSLLIAALMVGSTGSFAYDVKKALDGSDSAAEPALAPSLTHT